jgi:hypothetical protein
MKRGRRIWLAVSWPVLAVILGGFWLQPSRKQPDIRLGLTFEEVDRMLDGQLLHLEGGAGMSMGCLYMVQDWSGDRHRGWVTFDYEGTVVGVEEHEDPPPSFLDRVRRILRLD